MKKQKPLWMIGWIALAIAGATEAGSSGGAAGGVSPSSGAAGGLRAEADKLWAHRGNPDSARLALAAYIQASQADANDGALLARLSRAYYLVGAYVERNAERKDSLFVKGEDAGERAMAADPAYQKAYRESKDIKKAAQALGKGSIEAIYWYATNLGMWASTKNILTRLRYKSRLETLNQRVLDLDERFFFGAPHRFFGVLPTKIPGGDLKESKKHFEAALAIEPNYFGTRVLYAENYATKAKDKETFMKQLDYVLATPPSILPDAEPENRYEQEAARRLKARAKELFD